MGGAIMITRSQILWTLLVLMMTIAAIAAYVATKGKASDGIVANGPVDGGFQPGMLVTKDGRAAQAAQERSPRDSAGQFFAAEDEPEHGQHQSILIHNNHSNPNTSAAYVDGLYLGRLDAEQGRAEQVSVGRWAPVQDKELFVMGHQEAYQTETARLRGSGQTVRALLVLNGTDRTHIRVPG
jgi:hypothetical protein